MKKTKLLPLFLALGLLFTGCSKEDDALDGISPSSGITSTQQESPVFGVMTGDTSTSADEMRLENYTGNITLQNQNVEKAVVLGSRLVTGDHIETMIQSNAFVVLDKSKILRVNETSEVEIIQDNKHLDIYLSKGTVFFNVSSTLTAEESLEFHTNHVVTGVRGTSGIIHYDPVNQVTQIVVLTGIVTGTTVSEAQNIEAGQIAIVRTLEDGTVEMTIYELEDEDPIYYFSDDFIDGMQGDLNNEGQSVPLSEMVREPSEVSISGKVLSLGNVLAVEDENGMLHTIDNSSGKSWEGVSLGGMVNLTYFGDSVISMEQTSQGADVVGAVFEMFNYSPFRYGGKDSNGNSWGQWESSYFGNNHNILYFTISTDILTQAEKEAFLIRQQEGYSSVELRLGSWEDLAADAQAKGLTLQTTNEQNWAYNYYDGYGSYTISDISEERMVAFNIPDDGGIENFGLEIDGKGVYWFQGILNSDTMEYTINSFAGAG